MPLHDAFERALPGNDWPRLAHAGVLVALFDLRQWMPWLDDADGVLDTGQRQRAARQRLDSAKEELALAYALHRMVLGRALAMPAATVPLERDALGAPRIRGDAWFTSLSHAGGCAGVAVTGTGPVGIDLEPIARAGELPAIAHMVVSDAEASLLAGLPLSDRALSLLATWTRKEAFLKAEGVGLAREMSEFDAADGAILPSARAKDGALRVQMLDAGAPWTAAIAAPPGAVAHPVWIVPR